MRQRRLFEFRLPTAVIILAFCAPPTALWADDSAKAEFDRDVAPVLKRLCLACHGPANNESGIRLDQLNLNPDVVDGDAAEVWHDVLDQINLGEMPPPDAEQPTLTERKRLTDWIATTLREAAEAKRFFDGRVSTRRLTSYEYANTMRDLLGVDLDYARHLPPDPVSPSGFLNDGATLEMSPTQFEMYLEAARRALEIAIVSGEQPETHDFAQTETAIGNLPTKKVAGHQPVKPEFVLDLAEFPRHGEFELKITARAVTPGNEALPKIRVSMGHVPGIIHVPRGDVGQTDVTEASQTYVFRGRMEDFPQPGPVAFGNSGFKGMIVMIDFLDADGNELRYPDRRYAQRPPKPKKNKKNESNKEASPESGPEDQPTPVAFGTRLDIQVTSVEFKAPVYPSWPPPSHTRWLIESDLSGDESRYVRELLPEFMNRAFRRPVTADEVEQTATVFDAIRKRTETFEQAIRETFASVLVSPHFLYIVEQRQRKTKSEHLNDWELASRLSYFLWSSSPDETLRDLAAAGQLSQPDVLGEQVERMLSDNRCSEFVRRFVDQWLDLDALDRVAVNPEFFPEFDSELKAPMRKETQAYFAEILHADRSVLELLDSDWTMVNRALSKHYGIDGPRSSRFERAALHSTDRRGGLLWQAAFHLANSNGEDSHPIKRAVWILDRLLDSPPASPPPDVPELDAESPDLAKLTLKEQLAVHREKESCSNCHNGIDPWGIPFENFDAIGRWRTEIPPHGKRAKISVDAASVLPDGARINDVRQLQQYLLDKRREQFARSVVRRLMAYGLGRSLDFGDRRTAETLTKHFIENEYRLKSLITDFIQSDTFQTK